MAVTVEACIARNLGDRQEQQDRVAVFAHPQLEGTMMAILADGMGGHSGGAMAAEQVLFKAKQVFDAYRPRTETAEKMLENMLNEAHQVIKLTRFTSERDPHSTSVALLIQPGMALWAHCGDSRLYHFREGKLVSCTVDHSLVNELQKQGRITAEEALSHRHRNVLLSCLGGESMPQIDFNSVSPLTGGDSFLLCSDGLWAYFSPGEMARALTELPARNAAQVLIETARERAGGSGDNLSLAIVKLIKE